MFSRIRGCSGRFRNYPGTGTLDMVEPNLYISGEAEARNVAILRKYNITHILTINDFPLTSTVKESLPYIQIKYIRLPDVISSDLLCYFDETYEFIRQGLQHGSVLVHCQMGVSRSATVVIAYLMKKYNISARDALERLKLKRSVFPNQGFLAQLENYQNMGCSYLMGQYGGGHTRYMRR